MQIPTKKLKNGFEILEYGLGTWQMGGRREHDLNNDDDADITGIRAAIDHGVTCIDTAEIYAAGYSERLLGRAIKGYDRSKLFLSSKVSWERPTYDGVLHACEKSLKRIGTDYFDLYLLHSYPESGSLEESMRGLDAVVDTGYARHIGVCNLNVKSLRAAQSLAKYPIVYNQVHYNLEIRECEKNGLLKYCEDNDVILAAWRPVEKGTLLTSPPRILKEMREKYKKTSAQIAINWLLSQPNVITLAKTRHVEHLEENLGAIGWTMDSEDIERIRTEYPNQKFISPAVPLE